MWELFLFSVQLAWQAWHTNQSVGTFLYATGWPQRPNTVLILDLASLPMLWHTQHPLSSHCESYTSRILIKAFLLSDKEQAGGLQMWLWKFLQSFGMQIVSCHPSFHLKKNCPRSCRQLCLSQKIFLHSEVVGLKLCTIGIDLSDCHLWRVWKLKVRTPGTTEKNICSLFFFLWRSFMHMELWHFLTLRSRVHLYIWIQKLLSEAWLRSEECKPGQYTGN